MANLIPAASTLLCATSDYMEQELLPTLEGYHRFQTRVAINVLRTVMREIELAAGLDQTEVERLQALLGRAGTLAELTADLSARLADGRMALDAAGLVDHLRLTLAGALAIDNPKWIASDSPALPDPRTLK